MLAPVQGMKNANVRNPSRNLSQSQNPSQDRNPGVVQ